jgi:hypothetical protein
MRAVIYIRFSTQKQERGASRDRQLELCQQFCEQRGWPVDEIIEDLGRSAWTGAHLAAGRLGEFAARVRNGDVASDTVLVVEKLDRLSRQETRTTLRWMEDLCAAGLTISTVDGGKVYDDAGLRADLMGVFEILMRAKLRLGLDDDRTGQPETVLQFPIVLEGGAAVRLRQARPEPPVDDVQVGVAGVCRRGRDGPFCPRRMGDDDLVSRRSGGGDCAEGDGGGRFDEAASGQGHERPDTLEKDDPANGSPFAGGLSARSGP